MYTIHLIARESTYRAIDACWSVDRVISVALRKISNVINKETKILRNKVFHSTFGTKQETRRSVPYGTTFN